MSTAAAEGQERLRVIGRGGSLNLVGAVCQQACLFLTTALVARVLGQEVLGRYILCYALLSVASIVTILGLKSALTRFVAIHLADGDDGAIPRLVRGALGTSVGLASLLGLGFVLLAHPIAYLFRDSGLAAGIRVVGATVPAFTLRDLSLAAVQGWRTQKAFALIGWFYEPLARLLLTAIALVAGLGLAGAFAALTFGAWSAALAALVMLLRRTRALQHGRGRPDVSRVIGYALTSWGNMLAYSGLIWADTVILGVFASAGDVGLYTVAARLVGLAIFVAGPVDALFAPHFAHLFHRRDHDGLAAMYASSTNWLLRLSLPAFVVLLVLPDRLLELFGPGFASGAAVTVILVVGQLVNAATGPSGSLLNMSGHITVNLVDNAAALVLNIGLNLALIPAYGPVGAAVAWSVSLAMVNVVRLLQVRHLLQMEPFNKVTLKAFAAAVLTAVPILGLRLLLPDELALTLAGGAIALLLYVGVTVALRLDSEEIETLRGLTSGRRRAGPGAVRAP